jgi:hypothetical protein
MSIEQIWLNELNTFEREYDTYKKKRETIQTGDKVKAGGVQKKRETIQSGDKVKAGVQKKTKIVSKK